MNAPDLAYEQFDEPPEAVLQAVDAGLDSHNRAAAPIGGVRPLAVTAVLPSGEIIGSRYADALARVSSAAPPRSTQTSSVLCANPVRSATVPAAEAANQVAAAICSS